MTADLILETEGLTKEFRGFVAVRNVNLRVRPGSIHALIGPNGAGKTTCFNLLTHFLAPTRGHIRFKGRDITGSSPADIARLGLVRSFQISAVFPHLSVLENVRVALQRRRGSSFAVWRSERALDALNPRALELIEAVGLAEFARATAGELPYGRKRALEIATTLALEPEMMLLDEPTAGMAHEDVARISALIKRVAANRTVLMVEHNLGVVEHLSDTITVLSRGEILAEGDYATVSQHPDVIQAYMGAAADPAASRPSSRGPAELPTGSSGPRRGPNAARPVRPPGPLSLSHAPVASTSGAAGGLAAEALLAVADLHAWYDESHILHGVRFEVRGGEVVTLLGRNGAGKTTTLKSIMGMVPRRRGSVRFEGEELIGLPSNLIARRGLAFCPEERGIFASLNVEENLLLPPVVRPGGLGVDAIFGLFPNLRERLRSQGTKLSGGEQQMLAIGRILRSGARLLLLDEPTEGLAPVIVQQIGATLRRLKAEGFTILLVEQNFRFASTVADRHYVMEHGRVVDLIDNVDLERSMDKLHDYLGV